MWALRHLESWSGMQAFGAIAASPRGSAELGRLGHGAQPRPPALGLHGPGERDARGRAASRRATDAILAISERGERASASGLRIDGSAWSGTSTRRAARWPTSSSTAPSTSSAGADERAILAGDANLRPGDGRDLRPSRRARLLGAAAGQHRPDPRPRAPVDAARRVARRAAPRRRPAPLGSRAGRTHRRMTYEEARAQFPVLERLRLPERGHERAARAGDGRRVRRAGAARPRRGPERQGVLRARCSSCARRRAGLRRGARCRAARIALVELDVTRLRDRARRPRAHRRGRGDHDRPGALRPDGGRCTRPARASSSSRPTRTRCCARSRRARGSSRRRTCSGRPAAGSTCSA